MFKSIIISIILLTLPLFADKQNPPSLSSSSQLAPKSKNFLPVFAMDGKLKTSWVEGADGDGIGESLLIKYKNPISFKTISLYNGYGDPKLWSSNNRIKKLKVSDETGLEEIVSLKDSLSMQRIDLKKEFKSREVSLTILEVYKGSKSENTALAEVALHSDQAGSVLLPAKNTWAIGKWKTESNIAKINLHNDGTCEMGYETARMLCTWTDKGDKVIVSLEATLPLTNTDILELKRKNSPDGNVIEINGKFLFLENKDEV
ncbi:nicotine adenine dinucleotide glycohydrolase [Leptospira sp. 96542]|nr:nicotine adenine dinucleotide glycohydrolase [Leptospira sp. 96542]